VKWQSGGSFAVPSDCQARPMPCTVSPSGLLGHRSALRGLGSRGARLAAGGRPAAPGGRAPHLGMGWPSDGVSNTRPIVLAALRAIEHASRYPPRRAPSDKAGAGNTGTMQLTTGEHRSMTGKPVGIPTRAQSRRHAVSRAGSDASQGDLLRRRPKPAGLDWRWRRARIHASAPGGIRPASHQGELALLPIQSRTRASIFSRSFADWGER